MADKHIQDSEFIHINEYFDDYQWDDECIPYGV